MRRALRDANTGRRGACSARLAGCLALLLMGDLMAAESHDDFFYHARPDDTLIGIGKRLLLEPQKWHDVQTYNHIADPRRMPSGQIVRIPYDWLRTSSETATVTDIAGSVESAGRKLASGEVLTQGSIIDTGADGSVTLALADGSVVTLQKSSELSLEELLHITGVDAARSIRLKLKSGRVEAQVKPHRDVGRFEIVTPVAVTAVRGTHFRDGYDGADGHASAETLDGTVGVDGGTQSGGAQPVAVGAGFGTRVDPGKAPLPPVVLLPPPDLRGVAEKSTRMPLHVQLPTVAGAQRYRVQLADDPQFHALSVDLITTNGVADLALADGHHWLRARSIDALGLEGPDAVREIEQHELPPAPVPEPLASGAGVSGGAVHLRWKGQAVAPAYAFQLARDADMHDVLIDRPHLTTAEAEVDGLGPGRYYWRVAAINARGEAGAWSDVFPYDQEPVMSMPEVRLVDRRRLLFTWQAPSASTTGYRLQVARDADFTMRVLEQRLAGTEWSTPKLAPGVYYARVQPVNADGREGAFSAPRRFQVFIPLWAKIAAPLAVIGLALLL